MSTTTSVTTFETTDDHPWRTTSGLWLATLELKPGTLLQRAEGRPARVISVRATGRSATTYNLEVADFHTYFVGAELLWVHNACFFTKMGTKITGFAKHGINRAIGNGADRAGVSTWAWRDALSNPKKFTSGVDSAGRPFEVYTGQYARVVVNPQTGEIISMNPLGRAGVR